MRVRFQRVIAAAGAAFLIAIGNMQIIAAQTGNNASANGFKISPVRSEVTVEKGATETVVLNLTNPSDVSLDAQMVVSDFVPSDKEDGEPRLILDDGVAAPKNSFKTLVQPMAPVSIAPKETKDINVKLTVPANANAGGYYGAIRFVPANSSESGNVGLTASVGTIVLVTVPGDLKERLDLVQLSAAQNNNAKMLITSGDVQILTRLKNSGDIHTKPFGKVLVKDMFGKTVYEYEFNNPTSGTKANILPGSTRKFVDSVPKRKFLGRYTIESNLGYSQGAGGLITSKATFWYMPMWSLIALGVVLLLIIGVILFLVRKFTSSPKHGVKR